jgi:cytochrome d ubiquinol oxidase subunit I
VGLNELQASYEQQYGPGNYIPNVFVQYWSMRVMAYLATGIVMLSLWGAWLLYRRRLAEAKWFQRVAIWAVLTPFVMNTAGWMLTENGRQPWIVQGLMKTADGISPAVSTAEIVISLTVFALLYLALGIADLVLMLRYARRGLPVEKPAETVPALTY